MPTAFISHTAGDDAFVERLAARLAEAGIDVWLDSGRIRPGDDIIEKIEEGLSDATHVVVVLSPTSLLSSWVREESHAAQLSALSGASRLIPIIYGAMSPRALPPLLQSRLYVDFRSADEFERSISQLLSAFAVDGEKHVHESPLQLTDIQFAVREGGRDTAIELLLANTGRRAAIIKALRIDSAVPYHIHYYALPPTATYPLELTVGPRTANGVAVVGGAIGHDAEEWRRPVSGRLVIGPYHTELGVELPLYLAIGPTEEVLVRVPIVSVTTNVEPKERDRRASQRFETAESENLWGTRVVVTQSDGRKCVRDFPESFLDFILPLFAGDDGEIKHRLERRLRRG
jgi:hypothetical protein